MKENDRKIVEDFFSKLSDNDREKLQIALLDHVDEYRDDPIRTIAKCLKESLNTKEEENLKSTKKMERGKELTTYLNGPINEMIDETCRKPKSGR